MVRRPVRALAVTAACTGVAVLALSCESPSSDVTTRRSALAGDPIESVQRVEGVVPVTINNELFPPDGGSIDQTSFTIGLFEEDAAQCPSLTAAACLLSNGNPQPIDCPCSILTDLDPLHRGYPNGGPYPDFEDFTVVAAKINVGAAQAMHWDWQYNAAYQRPFGEFWAEVVDQNGQTTTVIESVAAPDGTGFRPNVTPATPPFLSGPQHVDLDLTPWSEQTISVRFILHTHYDPSFFRFIYPDGSQAFFGSFDAGTSKVYVANLHVDTCAVTSLEFLDIDSPIDDNPNLGGGKRVFVGEQSPGDGNRHDLVGVVARTTGPNCPVTLRSFDVDDPSDNTAIDPNGPAGGDNYLKKRGDFVSGVGDQVTLSSGSDNRAVTGFVVSRQPGDNFVIIAGNRQDQISKAQMTVIGGKFAIVDAAGSALPTSSIAASPMLTVWRRVHVQGDSMAQVTTNHVNGVITRVRSFVSSGNTLLASAHVSVSLLPRRFEGGRIEFNAKSFLVVGNDSSFLVLDDPTRRVSPSDVGAGFTLFDDDALDGSNQTQLHGDEGFEIAGPDMDLMADSDDPSLNVFAPAYVRPVYDIPRDFARPFVLNLEDTNNPFGGQMDVSGPDYWFVYLLGAYQGPVRKSNDPANGSALMGRSLPGEGSLIFHETIRDVGETPLDNGATTTAHEVGHLFSLRHGQGGIMGNNAAGGVITEVVLTPKSIRSLRRLVSP